MVMVYIWLAVLLASIIVELAVPALVSVWFAAGAFVSLILTSILTIFMGEDALFFIWLEILVFVIVSVLTVILIRPLILNRRKELKTNVDSMIGNLKICLWNRKI